MKCGCDNGRIIIGFSFNELPIWEDCPECGDHEPITNSAYHDFPFSVIDQIRIHEWLVKYESELKRIPSKE